jgi:glutamine amidotransferase-like uncharacterized protein
MVKNNRFIAPCDTNRQTIMRTQSVLVYVGQGASHSWTWLADLFEARGVFDVGYVDTQGLSESLTDGIKLVIISGGDGLRIASALGPHGFSHLKGFIHKGGTYVGICAGAYLPLPSSIEPFSRFNMSTTKIENIETGPQSIENASPRKAVKYGNCTIVHPVRGEMELDSGGKSLRAPLYGGPIFKEPKEDEVLVRYRGLTDDAEVQIEPESASSMISGRPAVIRARHGHGELLLFGPHLEHPRYPEANELFIQLIGVKGSCSPAKTTTQQDEHSGRFLARSLADLKVAILGLENRSFLVGNKLWDGGRFLELVNAMENRCHTVGSSLANDLTSRLLRVRAEILKAKPETLLYADEGPGQLVEAARLVVDNHFKVLRESRNR